MSELVERPHKNFAEFIVLLALCMSLVALSIDSMLLALPEIGHHFNIGRANNQQLVITFLFAGLAIGQLIAGPLSDSIGRKNGIYIGLILFIAGSLMSYLAESYEVMLVGRFIQGLGVAGPRTITVAVVRDSYEGREMAKVMSYIMGIFIIAPAVAPAIGQGVIHLSEWRVIFLVFIAVAVVIFTWLSVRLQETLQPKDKRPLTLSLILIGAKTVFGNRMTCCYMASTGFIYGAFIGYLSSSQQIFQDRYGVGELFPLYFGIGALAIGVAFFLNARLVRILGMRQIVFWSLVAMASLAGIFLLFEVRLGTGLPLYAFMGFILASTFCMGLLFGNFNALAMMPMGHLAGMASALIGSVSLVISMTAGSFIGQLYDGSLVPVISGFLMLSVFSLAATGLAERRGG